MPHIDKRTGDVVLRVIYDGAAEAGKTTNVSRLSTLISLQRRGAFETPGEPSDRTAFFDWLDFTGGFLDGHRVRCQLVSVPGQPELLHRRRYLLETADVVVFVADARRPRLEAAQRSLEMTRRIISAFGSPVPVGIVVQANKQDLPDALGPGDLMREMGLSPAIAVVPSIATTGEGVMQTFVLAARLATDRVRALLGNHAPEGLAYSEQTPAALYDAMQRLEAERAGAPERPAAPVATPSASTTDAPPSPEFGRHPRSNRFAAECRTAPRSALEIFAGHLWPPVRGRGLLANAVSDAPSIPEVVTPWAPPGAVELTTPGGWVFHTTSRWVFADQARGQLALLDLARRQLAWGDLIPDTRVLYLSADSEGWRVWMVTKACETLHDDFTAAVRRRDGETIRRLWAGTAALAQRIASLPPDAPFVGGTREVCLRDAHGIVLALNERLDRPPSAAVPLPDQLRALVAGESAGDPALVPWLDSLGLAPRCEWRRHPPEFSA